MARPLRIQYPNAVYHVMNRGLGRQRTFLIDDDYEVFLETIKESSRYFNVHIVSYCLMSNHYHLLVQTPNANLNRMMRHLNGVYTQRFNKAHRSDGPLFRGRYKAILVQEDEYLTHLIRYIHLNPITANLAQNLTHYPWTSHKAYLNAQDKEDDKGFPWLRVRLGLSFFSDKLDQALKGYQDYLKQGIDPQTQAFYFHKKQKPIFGDPDFIEMIKQKYIPANQKLSTEIPEKRLYEGHKITDRIIAETSKLFKVPIRSLGQSRRGQTNRPRLLAIYLTRELSGLTLPEIAESFNMNTYKTAATSCQRSKGMLQSDRPFKKLYDRLKLACSQQEI
jgi:putative transposase